jgi:hypothetical protein
MHATYNYVTRQGGKLLLPNAFLYADLEIVKSLRDRFDIAGAQGFLNCSQNLVYINDKPESFTEIV